MKFLAAILIAAGLLAHASVAKTPPARKPEDIEAATRLQVFLDRASFSPGKIDGHYGDFTLKALALYRVAQGGEPAPVATPPAISKGKPEQAPDVSDLDLSSAEPVFTSYTVTDADAASVGALPSGVPEKAKLKWLPYQNLTEAIAEKFHCDAAFLAEVNGGKTKTLKVGDAVKVPNVEPFELSTVKDVVAGSDVGVPVNDAEEKSEKEEKKTEQAGTPPPTAVQVDTKTNMLQVLEAGKILAAYPVTIGSAKTASPIGDWKVRGVAKLPTFRYDKEMLNHGKRSGDFHNLPPGPNNPVGVMWIALNKKGIGLHGTESPDTIGRASSHGCIRLANWDVVRLATKLIPGTPVSIH